MNDIVYVPIQIIAIFAFINDVSTKAGKRVGLKMVKIMSLSLKNSLTGEGGGVKIKKILNAPLSVSTLIPCFDYSGNICIFFSWPEGD